jgi:dUTP pyrophosphatase
MSQKISSTPVIGLVRLPHGEGLPLPSYETEGAAGMDVRAAVPADKPVTMKLGNRALIPTGFVFEIPPGYEVQVRPRSGLAFKHGVTCLNTPGTIDSDYRGEVHVLLINFGEETFVVERGMRIAQLIVAPVVQAVVEERALAGTTERGSGGFGSTGLQ